MKLERIKNLRIEKGITQEELANKLNISLSALGNYERGDRIPDASVISSLARCFGVTSDYILGLSDSPKATPEWPVTVPTGALKSVDTIKQSVDSMLSSAVLSSYGLNIFNSYAKIFKLLLEIDSFAVQKLHELQRDYPEFRQFGSEMEMSFDNTPILMALAAGYEEAKEFAQRLTTALDEIEDKVFEIKEKIDHILMDDVVNSIKGRSSSSNIQDNKNEDSSGE